MLPALSFSLFLFLSFYFYIFHLLTICTPSFSHNEKRLVHRMSVNTTRILHLDTKLMAVRLLELKVYLSVKSLVTRSLPFSRWGKVYEASSGHLPSLLCAWQFYTYTPTIPPGVAMASGCIVDSSTPAYSIICKSHTRYRTRYTTAL